MLKRILIKPHKKHSMLWFAVIVMMLISISCTAQDNDGLYLIKDEAGLYGYIDKTGKIVIKPQFEYADDFSEGLAAVGKMGYIDITGKIVITPQFEFGSAFREGVAFVAKDSEKVGIIDKTGRLLNNYTIDFNWAFFNQFFRFHEGLATIEIDKKYGYFDITGKIVIRPQFENANEFSEGLAAIKIDGSWGFIDKTGKTVIEPKFETARSFSEGLAAVKIDDEWGYIDKTGKIVIEPQYDVVNNFSEGLARVAYHESKTICYYDYIDKTGKKIIESVLFAHDFSEGLAYGKIGDAYKRENGFFNNKGDLVIKLSDNCSDDFYTGFYNGYSTIEKSGKSVFIDKNGKIMDNIQFDHLISCFDNNGIACVENKDDKGNNWVIYINNKGNIIYKYKNKD